MKNRLTSRLGFVAMAFLCAAAVTANADIDSLTKAKVVRIKGSARFTTGTGSWQPLKVGDVLTSGTVIQTAADSRVDVVLGDPKATALAARVGLPFASASPNGGGSAGPSKVNQNFLRLMENTVLSVDKLAATDTGADIVTDTQLDLRAGRIFGTVKKLSAGSKYEVKIPNGVAGVRGTIYMLSALGDCAVYEGSMNEALKKANGDMSKYVIEANMQYQVLTDSIITIDSALQNQFILVKGEATPPGRGSNPWGPVPPNGKDNPYVSPKLGLPGPPPGKGPSN